MMSLRVYCRELSNHWPCTVMYITKISLEIFKRDSTRFPSFTVIKTTNNLTYISNQELRCQKPVSNIWDKVFKNGPNKICERQPLKNLRDMVCLSRPYFIKFLKAVVHKFYLVHSWILCSICFILRFFCYSSPQTFQPQALNFILKEIARLKMS